MRAPVSYTHLFNPLIHEEICPVLRDFLAHVEGVPLASNHPGPVSYPVTVEPLHVALIPRLPLLHLRVELLRHGGVTKLDVYKRQVKFLFPLFELFVFPELVTDGNNGGKLPFPLRMPST